MLDWFGLVGTFTTSLAIIGVCRLQEICRQKFISHSAKPVATATQGKTGNIATPAKFQSRVSLRQLSSKGPPIDNIDWPLCRTSFVAALPWLWRELRVHRAFYGREFEMYRG